MKTPRHIMTGIFILTALIAMTTLTGISGETMQNQTPAPAQKTLEQQQSDGTGGYLEPVRRIQVTVLNSM